MSTNSLNRTSGKPRPLVSGNHFFPSEPDKFRSTFLPTSHSAQTSSHHPAALMLPHGGSGYTRHSVARLCSTLDLSDFAGYLLIAPVHREQSNTVWAPFYPGFETPFGTLNLPTVAVMATVARLAHVRMENIPFDEEPAFDLVLSILASQTLEKPILPLLAGSGDERVSSTLSEIMSLMLKKNYLPVLSINCRIMRPGEPPDFRCGEALFSLFTAHFHEFLLQWYHSDAGGYASSSWIDPRRETGK